MSLKLLVNCLLLGASLPAGSNGCMSQSSSRSQQLEPGANKQYGDIDGPQNTVAVVGSTATFNCTTTNSVNIGGQICWYRHIAHLNDIGGRREMLANGETVRQEFNSTFSVQHFAANQVESQLTLRNTKLVDAGEYRCKVCGRMTEDEFGAELTVVDSAPVCTKNVQHSSSVVRVSASVACGGRCFPVLQCSHSLTDQRQTTINYSVTNTTHVTAYNLTANVATADADDNFSCNVSFNTSVNVTAINKPSYPCRWRSTPTDDELSTEVVLVVSSAALLVVCLSFVAICYCVRRGSKQQTVGCQKTDTDFTSRYAEVTIPEDELRVDIYDEVPPRCTHLPVVSHCDRRLCSRHPEPSEQPLVYAELQQKRTPKKNKARANNRLAQQSTTFTTTTTAATKHQTYAAIDHNRRAY